MRMLWRHNLHMDLGTINEYDRHLKIFRCLSIVYIVRSIAAHKVIVYDNVMKSIVNDNVTVVKFMAVK